MLQYIHISPFELKLTSCIWLAPLNVHLCPAPLIFCVRITRAISLNAVEGLVASYRFACKWPSLCCRYNQTHFLPHWNWKSISSSLLLIFLCESLFVWTWLNNQLHSTIISKLWFAWYFLPLKNMTSMLNIRNFSRRRKIGMASYCGRLKYIWRCLHHMTSSTLARYRGALMYKSFDETQIIRRDQSLLLLLCISRCPSYSHLHGAL